MGKIDDAWEELGLPASMVATRNYVATLFMHALGASAVLEIGVGPGAVSGRTFALAMGMPNAGGVLTSIDIAEDRPTPEQRAFVERQGVMWRVYHGDSLIVRVRPIEVDVLYIDGDHGETHMRSDFERFAPYVRRGGFVIFDDVTIKTDVLGLKGQFIEYDPSNGNGHFVYTIT